LTLTLAEGSHVIYALQKTRRYKVISIDNYHNSHPAALSRVAQLAKDNLPPNPTESEKESTVIDEYKCDLTNSDEVRAVFEKYGKGGIWGVIHIAVRAPSSSSHFAQHSNMSIFALGPQSCRRIVRNPVDLLLQQCRSHHLALADHV
jgi:hypothetical protein